MWLNAVPEFRVLRPLWALLIRVVLSHWGTGLSRHGPPVARETAILASSEERGRLKAESRHDFS